MGNNRECKTWNGMKVLSNVLFVEANHKSALQTANRWQNPSIQFPYAFPLLVRASLQTTVFIGRQQFQLEWLLLATDEMAILVKVLHWFHFEWLSHTHLITMMKDLIRSCWWVMWWQCYLTLSSYSSWNTNENVDNVRECCIGILHDTMNLC